MPSFGEHQQWLQLPEQRANEVAPQVACAEYPSLAANNYYSCYYTGKVSDSTGSTRKGPLAVLKSISNNTYLTHKDDMNLYFSFFLPSNITV